MQTKKVICEARSSTNEILYYYYIISRTVYIRCARKYRMFISGLFFWVSLSTQNRNFKIQTDFGAALVWRPGTSVPSVP